MKYFEAAITGLTNDDLRKVYLYLRYRQTVNVIRRLVRIMLALPVYNNAGILVMAVWWGVFSYILRQGFHRVPLAILGWFMFVFFVRLLVPAPEDEFPCAKSVRNRYSL